MSNPFVGPHPLTRDDQIFGRDREIAELRHLITAERIVLLHSPSGAGKSSLINAGLIPELATRFDVWEPTRVNTEPPPNIANRYVWSAINGWKLDGDETTLKEFVTARPRANNVLLIFDQFEEILRINAADTRGQNEFFRQLAALLNDTSIWVLFVIREDYLAPLLPFAATLPTHLRTRYRLDFLARDQAKDAMRETAESGGRKFPLAALDALFNNLATVKVQNSDGSYTGDPVIGNYVEPMHLQVVCRRLWAAMPEEDHSIDLEDIRKFGDVNQALGAYFDESVKDDRAIREWFQDKLIRSGVRYQVQMGDKRSEGLSNRVIERLLDTHLIRAEKRRGVTWFELAHDRLVEPVLRSNEKWFLANLNSTQQRAALWFKQDKIDGLLLPAGDLPAAVAWLAKNKREATAVEREFVAKSQEKEAAADAERQAGLREAEHKRLLTRSLWRVRAFLAGAVLCLAIAGWQWKVARTQTEEAKKQEHNAVVALSGASVLDAGRAIYQLQDDLGLAHYARALRLDPGSLNARVGIALLLQHRHWQIQKNTLSSIAVWEAPLLGVSLSADGSRMMTAMRDERVQLWNSRTEQPAGNTIANKGGGATASLSADGRRAVTASDTEIAQVWTTAGGTAVGKPLDAKGKILSAALDAGGRRVVTVTGMGAQIWDVETGRPVGETPMREGAFHRAEFSADGTRVLTVSAHSAQVWEAASWKAVGNPIVVHEKLSRALFSSDGRYVVTLAEATAQVWDASTGEPRGKPMSAVKNIANAVLTPDGRLFTAAIGESGFQVWDALRAEPLGGPLAQVGGGSGAAFSADARIVVMTSNDGLAQVLRVIGVPLSRTGLATDGPVASVGFSRDGSRAVTASKMSARIWDVMARKALGGPIPLDAGVNRAEFSSDGKSLLTISGSNRFQEWSIATAQPQGRARFAHAVVGMGVLSDGRQLVMAVSEDRTAQAQDAATGTAWGIPFSLPPGTVRAGFTPDGKSAIVEQASGKGVEVWDLFSGKKVDEVSPRTDDEKIGGSALSPDGRLLVTASGQTAQIREVGRSEGTVGKPLLHRSNVSVSAFSADSRLLVTGQMDGTVQIWDAVRGEALGVPLKHRSEVSALAFSADGRRLITAAEGDVQVWDILLDDGSEADSRLLAEFAELTAGVRINVLGSPVKIPKYGEYLEALLAKVKQRPGALPVLIRRFLDE